MSILDTRAKPTPSASSRGVAGRTINLDTVSGDIHHLIFSDLLNSSSADLLNVAQSSKTLRDAALPYIYRNIILNGASDESGTRTAYQALVGRLQNDAPGQLTRHIRSITVKNEVPSEDLITILQKTSRHINFRLINWETSAHMSLAVYDMLHSTWPKPEIRVVCGDRIDAKNLAHRQMDMKLLSSPLLVSLAYVIYTKGYRADWPCRSDWPRISQALAAGGNVRYLHLRVLQDGSDYKNTQLVSDTETEKLPRLDLAPGVRLSQLEEITFETCGNYGQSKYLWDPEYCRNFRGAIDFGQLRSINFGGENPEAFFTCFAGSCPKLRSLAFGAWKDATEPVKRFIESLDGLERLDVSRAQAGMDDLWPAIMKHKNTLEMLILGPTMGSYCSPVYMELSRLEDIARTFPNLKRLGWDAPCERNIDAKHLAVLSSMKLKKLDLYLHTPGEANDYSDKLVQDIWGNIPAPQLDRDHSIAAAIGIADILSESSQGAFQWLTLHLSRTGYADRCQPWMMNSKLQLRRRRHADQLRERKWDVRGKFDWFHSPTLKDDLLFEEE